MNDQVKSSKEHVKVGLVVSNETMAENKIGNFVFYNETRQIYKLNHSIKFAEVVARY